MYDKMLMCSLVLLAIVTGSLARIAPSYIEPCLDLTSECLKPTIQSTLPHFVKGIPELGIDSLDPLKQKQIQLELPGGLKIQLNNGSVTGFRKCLVDSAQYFVESKSAELNLICNLTVRGQYKANGRILIVTINGDGDAKIKSTNVKIKGLIYFEDKVRDGVTYYEVKKYEVKHEFGDLVTFQLTNLFKGNPEISQAVLTFINENWRQLTEEFGDPIVKKLITLVFTIIQKFFKVVPKDELFIR